MEPKLKALDEQVIVIAGASSGIGLATAQHALSQHARNYMGKAPELPTPMFAGAGTITDIGRRRDGAGRP
jgi:NAD(P)-dependent dehydrogenase (short-subunit alcohol dehydrogenase family)